MTFQGNTYSEQRVDVKEIMANDKLPISYGVKNARVLENTLFFLDLFLKIYDLMCKKNNQVDQR